MYKDLRPHQNPTCGAATAMVRTNGMTCAAAAAALSLDRQCQTVSQSHLLLTGSRGTGPLCYPTPMAEHACQTASRVVVKLLGAHPEKVPARQRRSVIPCSAARLASAPDATTYCIGARIARNRRGACMVRYTACGLRTQAWGWQSRTGSLCISSLHGSNAYPAQDIVMIRPSKTQAPHISYE